MKKWPVLLLLATNVYASPLLDTVDSLAVKVSSLSATVDALSKDTNSIFSKYKMTNAGSCAMLVMGTTTNSSASISFIPGPLPVAGLQADVIVGPGITVTNIVAGPEATAQGKSVQAAPIPGGERFLLFGINATNLAAGDVADVTFDLTGASMGNHIAALTNFVAADVNGNEVPLCATTGVITK